MKMVSTEFTIKEERRQIAIIHKNGTEELAFFHKWTHLEPYGDCALAEMADGTMKYVRWHDFRFLPIGNEIPQKELEKTYREIGILKGGDQ